MSLISKRLVLLGCFSLMASCSIGTTDTFTFTADLPSNVTYRAIAVYVPAKGENCIVPDGRNTEVGFNRKWRTEYKPDSKIALYRTVSGCPMELGRIKLEINAVYGNDRGDFSSDNAGISIREHVEEQYKSTFNEAGESEFYGQCQWLFRTSGKPRILRKLLDCKRFDAEGNLSRYRPAAAFTPDQLPGKTVRMKITLAEDEEPAWGDTWVKVPNGWKRCMGDNFEDQHAFCNGNYTDFSTFQMVDGRQCTIYPGCTE